MSLARVVLLAAQAVSTKLAWTPPNKTPAKGRYHTDQHAALRIAPLIFGLQPYFVYLWAICETLSLFNSKSYPHLLQSALCLPADPETPSPIRITPLFIIGTLAVLLGAYMRIDCFSTLGKMFTFDLTVHPQHTLVTRRFYSYVRHPAYTGSILMNMGIALAHFTRGSWLTECGTFHPSGIALDIVWAAWWGWTLSVGVSRAHAEDKEMKKLFGAEWEAYAARVHWWFFPGIY